MLNLENITSVVCVSSNLLKSINHSCPMSLPLTYDDLGFVSSEIRNYVRSISHKCDGFMLPRNSVGGEKWTSISDEDELSLIKKILFTNEVSEHLFSDENLKRFPVDVSNYYISVTWATEEGEVTKSFMVQLSPVKEVVVEDSIVVIPEGISTDHSILDHTDFLLQTSAKLDRLNKGSRLDFKKIKMEGLDIIDICVRNEIIVNLPNATHLTAFLSKLSTLTDVPYDVVWKEGRETETTRGKPLTMFIKRAELEKMGEVTFTSDTESLMNFNIRVALEQDNNCKALLAIVEHNGEAHAKALKELVYGEMDTDFNYDMASFREKLIALDRDYYDKFMKPYSQINPSPRLGFLLLEKFNSYRPNANLILSNTAINELMNRKGHVAKLDNHTVYFESTYSPSKIVGLFVRYNSNTVVVSPLPPSWLYPSCYYHGTKSILDNLFPSVNKNDEADGFMKYVNLNR